MILENEIASISGQTLSESYLLMISRNHFLELLEDAAFSKIVMCSEAKKIRRLYQQLSNFPPAYTFVGDGEPFYSETCTYVDRLNKAGVHAKLDIS